MSGLPRHSAALPHVCDATVGSALQLSWSHGPPKPTPHAPEAHPERSTSGLHSRRALATSSASRALRLGSQAAAAGDATGAARREIIAESWSSPGDCVGVELVQQEDLARLRAGGLLRRFHRRGGALRRQQRPPPTQS